MTGNGDEAWSLSKDGILWKKLTPRGRQIASHFAACLVQRLKASVGPVDFLQGWLLDRIAANCLRQQALRDVERGTVPDLVNLDPYEREAYRAKEDVSSSIKHFIAT